MKFLQHMKVILAKPPFVYEADILLPNPYAMAISQFPCRTSATVCAKGREGRGVQAGSEDARVPVRVCGFDFPAPTSASSFLPMQTQGDSRDGSSNWALVTHRGDLNGVSSCQSEFPVCQSGLSPALAVMEFGK